MATLVAISPDRTTLTGGINFYDSYLSPLAIDQEDQALLIPEHVLPNGQQVYSSTFRLVGDPTYGDVGSSVLLLEGLLEQIKEYNDPDDPSYDPVYFQIQSAGENFPRAAVILGAELKQVTSDLVFSQLNHQKVSRWILSLTHLTPETYLYTSLVAQTGVINLQGGTIDFPDGGSRNSRISQLTLIPQDDEIQKLYVGIRKDPSAGVWEPVRTIGHPTEVTDITTDSSQITSTTFSTDVRRITFQDATYGTSMAYRFSCKLTGNPKYWVGKHTVLLVARMASVPATARVRASLTWQLPSDGAGSNLQTVYTIGDAIVNDNTYWIQDLGIAQFPPSIPRNAMFDLIGTSNLRINLEAQLLSGTPGTTNLLCGVFVFVPAENRIYIEDVEADNYLNQEIYIVTSEDGQVDVMSKNVSNQATFKPSFGQTKWELPRKDGVLVVMGQSPAGYDPDHQIDMDVIRIYKRWGQVSS